MKPVVQAAFTKCMEGWHGHKTVLSNDLRWSQPETPPYTLDQYSLRLAIEKLDPSLRKNTAYVWAACWNSKYTKYMAHSAPKVLNGSEVSVMGISRRESPQKPLQSKFFVVVGLPGSIRSLCCESRCYNIFQVLRLYQIQKGLVQLQC